MQRSIGNITAIEDSAADFLKSVDSCTSVMQRLQYFALQMHTSFLTSEMCRPFLVHTRTQPHSIDSISFQLHDIGIARLRRTLEAYMNMAQLSSLPLRSWSLTFEAFTAVCVLTVLELRRFSVDIDDLLSKFQTFLERELANEDENDAAATYSMLRRGRQLFRLLESSSNHQSGTKTILDSGATSQAPLDIQTTAEPPDEFATFYDNFWATDPFSNPDGTLLSMFDPLYNDFV